VNPIAVSADRLFIYRSTKSVLLHQKDNNLRTLNASFGNRRPENERPSAKLATDPREMRLKSTRGGCSGKKKATWKGGGGEKRVYLGGEAARVAEHDLVEAGGALGALEERRLQLGRLGRRGRRGRAGHSQSHHARETAKEPAPPHPWSSLAGGERASERERQWSGEERNPKCDGEYL
jgi:hypothetical protein